MGLLAGLRAGFSLAVLLFPAVLSAAPAPERIAFFAAWSSYRQDMPGFADLPETTRDARGMYEIARSFGYRAEPPLIDVPQRAFLDALAAFGAKARALPPGSQALVYVSAHGFGFQGENWIVPGDAGVFDENTLIHRTIPMARLIDVLGDTDEVARLIIVDMCRNDALGKGAPAFLRAKSATGMDPVNRAGVPAAPDGTLVLYATGRNTIARAAARPDQGYSLFTGMLMETLRESPGAAIQDVMRDTSRRVRLASGNTQRPTSEGVAGSIVVNPAPVGPSVREREALAQAEAARAEAAAERAKVDAERGKNAALEAKVADLSRSARDAAPASRIGSTAAVQVGGAGGSNDDPSRPRAADGLTVAALSSGTAPVPSVQAFVEFQAAQRLIDQSDLRAADTALERWLVAYPVHDMAQQARRWRRDIAARISAVDDALDRFLMGRGPAPADPFAPVLFERMGRELAHASRYDEACDMFARARDRIGDSRGWKALGDRLWAEEWCEVNEDVREHRWAVLGGNPPLKDWKSIKLAYADYMAHRFVPFDPDSSVLTGPIRRHLDMQAAFLITYPEARVGLLPQFSDEQDAERLSANRAAMVRAYLMSVGVPESRIRVLTTKPIPGLDRSREYNRGVFAILFRGLTDWFP